MKYILLVVFLFGTVGSKLYSQLSLGAALQKPGQLLSLYTVYSDDEGKEKSADRLKLFTRTVKEIAKGNSDHPSWKLGLNKFADMSSEEKHGFLGLNSSLLHQGKELSFTLKSGKKQKVKEAVDWREEGKTTGVKDQGSCGSCWAFGAVGPLETTYAIMTGKLKSFSEQEYTDCVFPSEGCDGGFYETAWDYSKDNGRLSLTTDAPYTGTSSKRKCKAYKRKHNGLIAAKFHHRKSYYTIPAGEKNLITYLAKSAVGIAFEVTDIFFNYESGIIKDTTCKCGNKGCGQWGMANHAVTAVGYTAKSMIVKNSWGTSWGEKGYFRTARGTDKCEYYRWGAVPKLVKTNKKDNDPAYVPEEEEEDCETETEEGCPCGTVMCEGTCKHAHMC
ncbi:uncharacterized protein LOC134820478 [Bolinopsis microptera]|uniref:uncharacterized protein LOC134820478 n=1 Tax=Bolinopsis microptera TaxID=2820187 RepID=UPI0030791305